MRKSDREITDVAEIEDILNRADVIHLAMVDDGRPYVVPMHFGYAGGRIYLHGAPEGRKIGILKKNPSVCFETFVDFAYIPSPQPCGWSTQYRSVIGAGRATIVGDKDEKITGLNVLMAKVGQGPFSYPDQMLARIAVIRIDVESMTGKKNHV